MPRNRPHGLTLIASTLTRLGKQRERLVGKMNANPTLPGFDVRDHSKAYWHIRCCTCFCTWYLPKDKSRRTKVAGAVLANHAATHRAEAATSSPSEAA